MRRGFGFAAVAGAALLLSGIAPGCSFIIDPKGTQCATDGDCARGDEFKGFVCDPASSVCVLSSTYCETNSQCIDANGAENFICDKTENVCKNLFSEQCTRLLADKDDLRDDNAIIMGLPWMSATFAVLKAGESAVELSRRDLKAAAGGIPSAEPGGKPRPLVWLVCDWTDQDAMTMREYYNKAMDTLVDRIGTPMMLGGLLPDVMADQVNRAAPKDIMIFSQVAQLPSYLAVPNARGLIFSLYPSIEDYTEAFVKATEFAETKLRAQGKTGDIKVTIAAQASPATAGAIAQFRKDVRFNGKSGDDNGDLLQVISIGNWGETPTKTQIAKAVTDIDGHAPDIIVCPSVSDCQGAYLGYESIKPASALWIGNEVMSNTDELVKTAAQQKKLLGIFPNRLSDSPNMKDIRTYFSLTFPDDFSRSPFVSLYHFGFYSAVLAAGVKDGNITGRALGKVAAEQISKDGEKIPSGLDYYQKAFETIRAGKKILGPDGIYFDKDGQGKLPALELFCPDPASFAPMSAGLVFEPANGKLTGDFKCGY